MRGELGFLIGYEDPKNFRSIYFSHVGRVESRVSVAARLDDEWRPISTQLTNAYVGDGRKAWIPIRVEIAADRLVVTMGEMPPLRLSIGSAMKGRIGFMLGAGSRAHESARIRKLRIRVAKP